MTMQFKKQAEKLIGVPIKIVWFVGEGHGSIPDESMFHAYGKILGIDDDLLIFEYTDEEKKRMQIDIDYFNLYCVNIVNISVLNEHFDSASYLTCPHCKEDIKLIGTKLED